MVGRGSFRLGAVAIIGGIALFPSLAWALPEMQEESDTVDDATITLRLQTEGIIDDPLFWCEVEIDVVGAMVPFTEGDTVLIEFTEDDIFFNDVIWTTMHTITAAEATANSYNEVFDCSGPVMADGIGDLEFFAEAEVVKDMCGTLCVYDRPTTANMPVVGLEDDDFEEDDAMGDAPNAVTGTTEERIARDEDWVRVILQEPGDIEADFQYVSLCGEIDAVLVDDNDDMVAEIEPGMDSGVVTATALPAGVYFLQIQPADAADFNFYDLTVDVTPNPDGGTGGETTGDSSGASASATASDSGASASATASDSGASASASASDSSAGSGSSGSDTDLPPGELFEQDDGCGCRHRGDSLPAAWMLLGLLGLIRRRTRL